MVSSPDCPDETSSSARPPEHEQVVGDVTRSAVHDCAPDSLAIARARLTLVSRLTILAWQMAGLELDRAANLRRIATFKRGQNRVTSKKEYPCGRDLRGLSDYVRRDRHLDEGATLRFPEAPLAIELAHQPPLPFPAVPRHDSARPKTPPPHPPERSEPLGHANSGRNEDGQDLDPRNAAGIRRRFFLGSSFATRSSEFRKEPYGGGGGI
jgi:hypothetical protein